MPFLSTIYSVNIFIRNEVKNNKKNFEDKITPRIGWIINEK